ncbi:MAG: hypothetical protein M3135_00880 [Actinomycetota bacterium]|nr:hypothetical protein [Actinomycetota bacterium]
MRGRVDVYLELGTKRVFAGAIEWPGWCRSGRDEDAALEALVAYGPRYSAALGRNKFGFEAPADVTGVAVAEHLKGNATTDFGAPGAAPRADERRLDQADIQRLISILTSAWAKFDRAAEAARGKALTKGPRGGGRELEAIVTHVLEADGAYHRALGGVAPKSDGPGAMSAVRSAIVDVVSARARGEPPPRTPRSGKLWTPRYGVRRSAWHALDHAWEIEDRAKG